VEERITGGRAKRGGKIRVVPTRYISRKCNPCLFEDNSASFNDSYKDNSRCVQYRLPIRNATYSIMTIAHTGKRGKSTSRLMPILSGEQTICSASVCALSAYQLEGDTADVGVELLISVGKAENRRLPSNDVLPRHDKGRSGTVAFDRRALSPREPRG
jgi:hypothetical protein